MSPSPFGYYQPGLLDRRRRHRLLLAGVSLAAVMLVLPSFAETYDYANGDTDPTDIELADDNEFIAAPGITATHSGVISGAGSINKLGAGQLNLSGINNYTGGTLVSAGTLGLLNGDAAGTGTISINGGAGLYLGGGGPLTLANDIQFNGTGSTINAAQDALFAGQLTGIGGFVKTGDGVLTLQGDNSYSGTTYLYAGTIHVASDTALGTGGLQVTGTSTLSYADGATVSNDILANGTLTLRVDSGTATQAGRLENGAVSGVFIRKQGAGDLRITGQMWRTNMGTTIFGGRLIAAAENVLDPTGLYTPQMGAQLLLEQDQIVGAITGTGSIDLGSRRLTVAGNSGATFNGELFGEEDANLKKTGTGWLKLTGDGAGYSGRFEVEAGLLEIDGAFGGTPVFVQGGRLGGSGSVWDVFIDSAILEGKDGRTLSMRDLQMTASTILRAQLGTENVAALFEVAGDLILDGTLEVEDIGGFGPGVYRLFNYGGTLDDRGLEIGSGPDGYDATNLEVQTAVAGQVNLVADDPDYGPVVFWDGGDASKYNNGAVDGGDGQWRRGGSAFTDANGIANGPMNPHPGFVVFTGRAGNVSVYTGFGEIHPDGMQFAVDGYRVSGELISWDAGDRIVRVGDGTAAGANYTAEISAKIDGPGRLVKTDLGTLILSNEDNAYSGGTEVRDGTLLVNGTIGDVDVLEMGRLGGTGKVDNADIRGTLAAGQSIGTLWIDGDLTMRAGSVFEVEVDADGNADRIDVTGVARLEGGRVVTLASGGDYADQTTYTILSAEGGVEGEFEGIEANLAFLTASLAYNAKDVQLSLSRNSTTFSNVGETRNQIAAAGAVEPLGVGNAIYDRVLTLSAEDARLAFDQVSGEVHAAAKGIFAKTSDQVRLSVDERVNASFARLGEAGEEKGVGANVWTSGNAAYGTLRGDGNAAPATFGAGNLFVGADAVFNDSWMLGVMGGVGRTSVRVGDRNSELSSSDYHVGVYGAGEVADFTFTLGGSYTHHEVSSTRTPTFPGFSETITADYSAGTSQVFGEIGHKFRFDSGLVIEPFANLALVNVYSGGYEEKGGVAALSAGSSSYGAGIISLGVRGSQKFTLGDDIKAEIKGALGWTHVAAGTPEATHSLGGNAFTVAGAPIDSDALTIKGGIGLALSENASLDFGYSGQLGSQGQTHGVNGTLSVKF